MRLGLRNVSEQGDREGRKQYENNIFKKGKVCMGNNNKTIQKQQVVSLKNMFLHSRTSIKMERKMEEKKKGEKRRTH
jgi:hypothetical protein